MASRLADFRSADVVRETDAKSGRPLQPRRAKSDGETSKGENDVKRPFLFFISPIKCGNHFSSDSHNVRREFRHFFLLIESFRIRSVIFFSSYVSVSVFPPKKKSIFDFRSKHDCFQAIRAP